MKQELCCKSCHLQYNYFIYTLDQYTLFTRYNRDIVKLQFTIIKFFIPGIQVDDSALQYFMVKYSYYYFCFIQLNPFNLVIRPIIIPLVMPMLIIPYLQNHFHKDINPYICG